jgi:hypothetical protein
MVPITPFIEPLVLTQEEFKARQEEAKKIIRAFSVRGLSQQYLLRNLNYYSNFFNVNPSEAGGSGIDLKEIWISGGSTIDSSEYCCRMIFRNAPSKERVDLLLIATGDKPDHLPPLLEEITGMIRYNIATDKRIRHRGEINDEDSNNLFGDIIDTI